jgi:hypothetical protein
VTPVDQLLSSEEHTTMSAILIAPDTGVLDRLVCQNLVDRGFVRAEVGGYVLTLAGHRRYLASVADKFKD